MSGRAQTIAAELTWTGGRFAPGIEIEVGDDGRIGRVGAAAGSGDPEPAADEPARPPLRRLPRRALLPGFVNAHSHAFQRGLRGRGETFPATAGSFWSWREAMYGLVGDLDPERFYRLSLQAFREMRAAGVTTVGEFHYLHHNDAEDGDYALDPLVLAAAAEAGLRIVLLNAYYATGGIGAPLAGAQLRFASLSPAEYWEQMDRLSSRLAPDLQTLGAVVHSVRAAGLPDLAAVYAEARRRGLRFHMHVEEQPLEIEETVAAYGRRPMALLNDELEISPAFTAVHCTHTAPADLERFVAAGGNVCVCPLTEANLGDGIPPLTATAAPHDRLCLGTDSNARISMLEEMRWLEYAQRLAGQRRGVLREPGTGSVARTLLDAATAGGARALGVEAGEIATGLWADFVAVDLDHPSLALISDGTGSEGVDASVLAAALVFGAADGAIAATCVGGLWDGELL